MRKPALFLICTFLFCVAAAQAQQAPSDALTDASLKTMLINLGYTVEETKTEAGGMSYSVNLAPMEGWKVVTSVGISSSKTFVWLTSTLFAVPESKSAPADPLLGMLAENDDIGPIHFSYNKSRKKFYLNDPIPNQGVTPAVMRDHLDRLNKALARTEPLWNPDKWPGAKPAAK